MPKVREAIGLIERDGWQLVRTRGSHRQYRHPIKPGAVTVPGKPGDDLPRSWDSIMKQSFIIEGVSESMKYTVVIEKAPSNYA